MTRTIFGYGIVAGAIIIAGIGLTLVIGGGTGSVWAGYVIMLVALSLIFVGVKRYRDTALGGVIRFGTAFAMGLGIAAVASVVYVAIWESYLAITDYRFMADYAASAIEAKRAAGASASEIAAVETEMATMQDYYANPLMRVGITLMEIFPVGLLVALVSAALVRNSRLLPARG